VLDVWDFDLPCYAWKEKFPKATVYLKTKRSDPVRSGKWEKLGFKTLSSEEGDFVYGAEKVTTPFVVFCAPPTNNPRYNAEVEYSIKNDWSGCYSSGDQTKGSFVFTSSGGVYSENSGGFVDETSPVNGTSARYEMILKTENAVVGNGGCVVRYAGLYATDLGPHNYWLRMNEQGTANTFESCPNGLINLIHYDDAAVLLMHILLSNNTDKKLFLASDGHPISRIDICKAALQSPHFQKRLLPSFTGDETVIDGKRYIKLIL